MQHLTTTEQVNIARFLPEMAGLQPGAVAVRYPAGGRDANGQLHYESASFQELESLSNAYAHGMSTDGVGRGTRVLMLAKPGLDFIALSFALFKLGAVPILIDPGIGVKNMLDCVRRSRPEVLLGIRRAQSLSLAFPGPFSSVRLRVTIGRRLMWGGPTVQGYRQHLGQSFDMVQSAADDLAAILFTSGSTGSPKGVCYQHGQFAAQLQLLRSSFGIQPGEVDLPMLPVFALFNPALGMTTVVPRMNPSRPATVDPRDILDAIRRFKVTNSFGSPVLWKKISRHCLERGETIPHLRRVLMAGAPVHPHVLRDFCVVAPQAEPFTPYGATEALPLTLVSGRYILEHAASRTMQGAGTCVGKTLPGISVRIEGALRQAHESHAIGEIVVSGEVVTLSYDQLPNETARAKIVEDGITWHRMGDMGYVDNEGLLWFCGRRSHMVEAAGRTYYSVCCEAIFNQHPLVSRSALIRLKTMKSEIPAIVVELNRDAQVAPWKLGTDLLRLARSQPMTEHIANFFIHPDFPVDVRHNAKIHREELSDWAVHQDPLPTVSS